MNSNEIQETLCESYKIMAEAIVEQLHFDKTVVCTVVDASTREQGYVTVSDGQLEFKAYSSDGESFAAVNGTKFYVTIPLGDYSQKKIIRGKYDDNNATEKISYFNPVEQMVRKTPSLIEPKKYPNLYLNNSSQLSYPIELDSDVWRQQVNLWDTVYISAEFKCPYKDRTLVSGAYGIQVYLLIDDGTDTGLERVLTLRSDKDMFGNVYAFDSFFKQEAVYDITQYKGKIKDIWVKAFQNGQFKEKNDDNQIVDIIYDPINRSKPIEINNICLIFGKTAKDIGDGTLELYTPQDLNYSAVPGDDRRTIQALWYNSDKNKKQIGFADIGEYEYYYKWTHYNSGEEKPIVDPPQPVVDPNANEADPVKEHLYVLDNNIELSKTFTLNTAVPQDIIQLTLKRRKKFTPKEGAIGLPRQIVGTTYIGFSELDMTTAPLEEYTDDITFLNVSADEELLRYDENNALSIELGEGAIESYSFYGDDGLITSSLEAAKTRQLRAVYAPRFNKTRKNLVGTEIKWKVPGDKTMLVIDDSIKPPTFSSLVEYNNESKQLEGLTVGEGDEAKPIITDEDFATKYEDNDEVLQERKNENDEVTQKSYTKLELIQKLRRTTEFDKYNYDEEHNLHVFSKIIQAAKDEQGNEKEEARAGELLFSFLVADEFFNYYTNNTINCFLDLWPEKDDKNQSEEDQESLTRAKKSFVFSASGGGGTSYSFKIIPEDNRYVLDINGDKPINLNLIPKVFDTSGTEVTDLKFEYRDMYGDMPICMWTPIEENGKIQLENLIPHRYTVIQVKTEVNWLNKNTTLTAYYPICWSGGYLSPVQNLFYYDSLGKLEAAQSTQKLSLEPSATDLVWYVAEHQIFKHKQNIEDQKTIISYTQEGYIYLSSSDDLYIDPIKEVDENGEETDNIAYWELNIPRVYLNTDNAYSLIAVSPVDDDQIYYKCPLVFIQNKHTFPILNSWDGSTKVDNEGKRIFSTTFVAGKKNFGENSFSGIVMGDLGKVGDESARQLGLFGFKDGLETFSLTVDGELVLGSETYGQIKFDGVHGVIEGKKRRDKDGKIIDSGMKIDLFNEKITSEKFSLESGTIIIDSDPQVTVFDINSINDFTEYKGKQIYSQSDGKYYDIDNDGNKEEALTIKPYFEVLIGQRVQKDDSAENESGETTDITTEDNPGNYFIITKDSVDFRVSKFNLNGRHVSIDADKGFSISSGTSSDKLLVDIQYEVSTDLNNEPVLISAFRFDSSALFDLENNTNDSETPGEAPKQVKYYYKTTKIKEGISSKQLMKETPRSEINKFVFAGETLRIQVLPPGEKNKDGTTYFQPTFIKNGIKYTTPNDYALRGYQGDQDTIYRLWNPSDFEDLMGDANGSPFEEYEDGSTNNPNVPTAKKMGNVLDLKEGMLILRNPTNNNQYIQLGGTYAIQIGDAYKIKWDGTKA